MMREIKFRAWDGRKMFYDLRVHEVNLSSEIATDTAKKNLMQFTGLKDKNGKEIYEGDIVKYKQEWLGVITYPFSEVKYTTEHFNDGEYGYSMGVGFEIDWNEEDNPEVIGNIYENPELLKSERGVKCLD